MVETLLAASFQTVTLSCLRDHDNAGRAKVSNSFAPAQELTWRKPIFQLRRTRANFLLAPRVAELLRKEPERLRIRLPVTAVASMQADPPATMLPHNTSARNLRIT